MSLITVTSNPLSFYLEALEARRAWRFSRWGDGEWNAVLNRRPGSANCDKHQFFPDMGRRLCEVLQSQPKYWMGLQPLAVRMFSEAIQDKLKELGWSRADWHDADVFHRASGKGKLLPLIQALQRRQMLFIAPSYMEEWARRTFSVVGFIAVPDRDCWTAYSEVLDSAVKQLSAYSDLVVSISFSMPAEILVDDLDIRFPGQHTIIDFGSLWDPYAGKKTRKYHHQMAPSLLASGDEGL